MPIHKRPRRGERSLRCLRLASKRACELAASTIGLAELRPIATTPVPSPSNVSVTLPFGTEVTLRFSPTARSVNMQVNLRVTEEASIGR